MVVPGSLAEKEVKSVLILKTKGKIPQRHRVRILWGERVFFTRDRLIHFPRDWPGDAPGRRAGASRSTELSRGPPEEADKIKQGKVLRGRRQLWPCGGARLPKEGCCWPSVWVLSARVLALSTSSYMRRVGSGDPPCVCFSWLLRSRP